MKKTLCVFLALFLAFSLLSVPALADGEDSSFEPVTVADDESVKVVVTDLVNSPEDSSASFTLEITNKTDEGHAFYLFAFSVNDRMCPLSWTKLPEFSDDGSVYIYAGETVSISAGWDKSSLAQVGVNYVQSAEGYISPSWNYDEELSVPISLPFPAVEMGVPATEDVIYDTDFEPVTIVDDEGVTAIVHDYYVDEDSGVSLVISVENRTGEKLAAPYMRADIDGVPADTRSISRLLPPGKTMIEALAFTSPDPHGWKIYTSADSMDRIMLTLGKYDGTPGLFSGDGVWNVELDISPYADATSSVYGTAAWVADPTPPETPQPTEGTAGISSVKAENADLIWAPDPETDADATVTLGNNGEYVIGMTYDESFQAIILYFENNSNNGTDFYTRNVMVNGSSFPYSFGYLSSGDIIQPGGATNYLIVEQQTAFPSDGFDTEIELRFTGEDSNILLDATVTVSFAADGSATIEQVS